MNGLWLAALFTGLTGSLHCVGMCGPLAMAIPLRSESVYGRIMERLQYNFSRIAAYALLGIIAGVFGKNLASSGFQQTVSIVSGSIIVIVGLQKLSFFNLPALNRAGNRISSPFLKLIGISLKKKHGHAIIGFLNGFLPCGFVYIALAGAINSGSLGGSAIYMMLFGLGTIPLMLAVGLSPAFLPLNLRIRLNKAVPYLTLIIGVIFILRGMDLGIPFLSPEIHHDHVDCCKRQ